MNNKDKIFLKRLLEIFKIEAEEHINLISKGIAELDQATPSKKIEIFEIILREVHSLKGAARTVNIEEIEIVSQSLESLLAMLKNKETKYSKETKEMFNKAIDNLREFLKFQEEKPSYSYKERAEEIVKEIENVLKKSLSKKDEKPLKVLKLKSIQPTLEIEPSLEPQEKLEETPKIQETVRISLDKLNTILLKSEEMISLKLMAQDFKVKLKEIYSEYLNLKNTQEKLKNQIFKKEASKTFNPERQNKIFEAFKKYDECLKSYEKNLSILFKISEQNNKTSQNLVDNLLSDIKEALMLPFSLLIEGFPPFIRKLSNSQQKEVDFFVKGADIQIDRRILEAIKDPLTHLIRNCIDHGIEKPEVRESKNKPRRGKINLIISQEAANKVQILISDDGQGIDLQKIKLSALKTGVIEKKEEISDEKALFLIFASGISTSSVVTNISGRGLGLAIVKEKVEMFNGSIFVETKKDLGTSFKIILPLTLSTMRGVLVKASGDCFFIPSLNIKKILRMKKEDVKLIENKEMIKFDEKNIPLIKLSEALELPQDVSQDIEQRKSNFLNVIVLNSSSDFTGFLVDEILEEQELLLKNLPPPLYKVKNVMGLATLPSGRAILVLNTFDLIKSAALKVKVLKKPDEALKQKEEIKKLILVVEDSIVAREFLKNVLELSNFNVETAVNGIDAFLKLKEKRFDLVVSDIDMPEMNGFDLTVKIRSDKDLKELPIVLVTALESSKDKEKGLDAGANAYIVKSSFKEDNLLEVIKRLI